MEHPVDLSSWPRAGQFHFFRGFQRPHFAVTSRIDVTHLMTRLKPAGVSPYRASLYGIGTGIHAVPELLMRFRGDSVIRHDAVDMSMTVPTARGSFSYAYVPYDPDFSRFGTTAKTLIDAAARTGDLAANTGERDDLCYMSCMPWLDYSSINNAMPGPDDCIPRVSWGKIVELDGKWSMAMTLEVHHALADGAHVGAFFTAVQEAMDSL
ncbi:chloramphenicol acetyltransferase [Gymnodinialimonas ceratoperidinii]|uniref:Chloramphenicol acetyltransferase n=1 Tax=Gymnodinialimonas ceratoperidinii TaxID=2856823 RepID=A0A8F6YD14_9RHOB|nr:chloramphenicol acetyltransferase [Gymnodinialimonas ceratoperidinii]QXT39925.1 chloramphenicol acetyltransferase [Gymnodinialimonas ceratoperidinii]